MYRVEIFIFSTHLPKCVGCNARKRAPTLMQSMCTGSDAHSYMGSSVLGKPEADLRAPPNIHQPLLGRRVDFIPYEVKRCVNDKHYRSQIKRNQRTQLTKETTACRGLGTTTTPVSLPDGSLAIINLGTKTMTTINKLQRKQLAHKHDQYSCNGWTEFVQTKRNDTPTNYTDSSYRMKKQEEKLKLESKGGWK